MSNRAVTPEFRVSFPQVFKPVQNEKSGDMEYKLTALFPKGADLSALKSAAEEALIEKFGLNKELWPKGLRSPFRDQGELTKKDKKTERVILNPKTGKPQLYPGCEEGAIFMRFKTKQKPGVVDAKVQPIIDENEFYAGCWARASVTARYYSYSGNTGITFYLSNVQKVKDGEPLGGSSRAEDDFAPIEGAQASSSTAADSLFN